MPYKAPEPKKRRLTAKDQAALNCTHEDIWYKESNTILNMLPKSDFLAAVKLDDDFNVLCDECENFLDAREKFFLCKKCNKGWICVNCWIELLKRIGKWNIKNQKKYKMRK